MVYYRTVLESTVLPHGLVKLGKPKIIQIAPGNTFWLSNRYLKRKNKESR